MRTNSLYPLDFFLSNSIIITRNSIVKMDKWDDLGFKHWSPIYDYSINWTKFTEHISWILIEGFFS
jgi:hypothetical protein